MENPPADMGLNFPPPKKGIITDDAVLVDPLVTNSIELGEDPSRERVVQAYTRDQPVLERRLLTVINGLAFVEISRVNGREIVSLNLGSDLPGAGAIEHIERVDGRWRLVAGDITLLSERR